MKSSLETDKNIEKAVEILKREFNATRLFLFGSRANGTATADSDYDFVLVVKESVESQLDNMIRARSILHNELKISADVFVYPQTEFDEWKNEFNSIPEIASNLGMELPLE